MTRHLSRRCRLPLSWHHPLPTVELAPSIAMGASLPERGASNTRAVMFLNRFADTTEPLDMTGTEEFRSLLASAADLGIPHVPSVRYVSRNVVLRQLRFH